MMEEKHYELVAWTRKEKDSELQQIRMIPTLYFEMQEPYFDMAQGIDWESTAVDDILKRISFLEKCALFEFNTGHYSEAAKFLKAADKYIKAVKERL